ncbi:MAG: methyl-accepting chemotaxis protein [Ktedonobacteraceae bacterium]|nr:methyl-accepting chemotaxis protein [Ktedonobacteraceae bacterium]
MSFSNETIATADRPTRPALAIRPKLSRGGHLLLDLPIASRLTLGFLTAALIAAFVAGAVGIQRSQSLSRQSDFYQSLLEVNTALTTGANFLQLMNTETHAVLEAASVLNPSRETINQEQDAVQVLATRYDSTLTTYITSDLLIRHPDQINLLDEAGHTIQVGQQQTLASSALRTWHLYSASQQEILQDVKLGNITQATFLERAQSELTNADARSALSALIQFNARLAASVRDAARVEEQRQLLTTIVAAILAFIAVALVGLFISGTLVHRLRQLRQITQAVEQGQLHARATVIGRDEIADVSASVNAMLETIIGLLEETRRQRDALTNAATHLFHDMHIVSAGDLRADATVSNDPIGLLADAFNFTISRFRRFVVRAQSTIEQMDVISQQELARSEVFAQLMKSYLQEKPAQPHPDSPPLNRRNTPLDSLAISGESNELSDLAPRVKHIREYLRELNNKGIVQHTRAMLVLAKQISHALRQLSEQMNVQVENSLDGKSSLALLMHLQELRTLENSQLHMVSELDRVQKNTTHGFRAVDTDLDKLTTVLLPLKPDKAQLSSTHVADYALQGIGFSHDITMLARKLTGVAQELHTAIVSFQLHNTEGSTPTTNAAKQSYVLPEEMIAEPHQRPAPVTRAG